MIILALSDTHGKHRLLRNLPEADVIIHAGDVTKDGSERSALDFLNWFSGLDYKYKIFIAGNHDFFFEQESENYVRKQVPEGVYYLNDSGITIEGIHIWGSAVTPWYYDWAFNRQRGKDINKHWKRIPGNTDVLVTHGPPWGILDQVGQDASVGCADLLKRVEVVQPRFHVFGHIHPAYGQLQIAATTFINAALVNDAFELVNVPQSFEIYG